MAKIHEKHRGYKELRPYVDMCTRSCHREVRYEGVENIPQDSAVLLAPNHCAALMDAMVILATPVKGGVICFGARSDIFKNPKVARILRWLRIVPLARERNGLSEVAKNFEVFDEIIECLDNHVPFCMFSEGTHRAQRGMLPIKKGIFRLARMAIEKTGKPVYIVPAGIDYEDYYQGQRRVTVRYGEPIDVGAAFAEGAAAGRPEIETYRQLAATLRGRDLALLGLDPDGNPLPNASTFSAQDLQGENPARPAAVDGTPASHTVTRAARPPFWLRIFRIFAVLILFPVFLACTILSLPIWLPLWLIMRRMKDKAWTQTVRFGLHLFLPIFIPFHILQERISNYFAAL